LPERGLTFLCNLALERSDAHQEEGELASALRRSGYPLQALIARKCIRAAEAPDALWVAAALMAANSGSRAARPH